MSVRNLAFCGLGLLLLGLLGMTRDSAARGKSVADDAAAQVMGGQSGCMVVGFQSANTGCGQPAKINPNNGQILTYCPYVNSNFQGTAFQGWLKAPFWQVIPGCTECGMQCGSYSINVICQ